MQPDDVKRRVIQAKLHLKFCTEIYKHQLRQGAHFLHEHPATAESWAEECMERLKKHLCVEPVIGHMCQYGMVHVDKEGVKWPVLKPTKWLSSSLALLRRLSRKCPRGSGGEFGHKHIILFGKEKTQSAAIYPPELCRQILLGIQEQMKLEAKPMGQHLGSLMSSKMPVYDLSKDLEKLEVTIDEQDNELEDWDPTEGSCGGSPCTDFEVGDQSEGSNDYQDIRDSVSGDTLPAPLVEKAHQYVLDFMQDWKIGDLVPTSTARQRTGKMPIRGKWVNVNKQDEKNPLIRSRYVACEVNTYRDESLYASTPPLEALRFLLSWTATRSRAQPKNNILLVDVRKAHLHADAEREVYVQLPPELRANHPGKCWRLRKCLCGIRDAPKLREALYTKSLVNMGFVAGKASASCFFHPKLDVSCVVHGDDFSFSGNEEALCWVQKKMEQVFLCNIEGKLGEDLGDLKQTHILNRIISWEKWGGSV